MASIRKTKHGTYEVRYRTGNRQRSKTFRKKVSARKFLTQAELHEHLGKRMESEERERQMSFEELADYWIENHAIVHKAASSVIRDKQMLRDYIIPFLGSFTIQDIRRRDIVRLQGHLAKQPQLSAKSVNTIVATVQKILNDGVAWDYISENVARGVKRIKCPEVEYKFWSRSERDRFLTFSKSRNTIVYEIVAFAVYTGLRSGEIKGLLRDCLDFDNRLITVKRNQCHKTRKLNEHTKGKNIRQVPMNDAVYEILKDRRLLAPNQHVFGNDMEHFGWRHFKPMQAQAGVNTIPFHGLRHTFASHLVMAGVSVFKVQKLLGHSDIQTTMRYAHLAPEELKGVTDVLLDPVQRPQFDLRAETGC